MTRVSDEEIRGTIRFLDQKARSDHAQKRLIFWKGLLEQRQRSVVQEVSEVQEQQLLLEV